MKQVTRLILSLISIGLLSLICSNSVNAESLSWTSAKPKVVVSEKASGTYTSWCRGYFQNKYLYEPFPVQKKVCVTPGELIKFGSYFEDNTYHYVIGTSFDSKIYKFIGPCWGVNSCMYLSGSDTLIVNQFNGVYRTFTVYKNFSYRLTNKSDNFSIKVIFDSSNPDFEFKSSSTGGYSNGQSWGVGSFNASANGKWVAVEMIGLGIGLFNVDTLEMRRVSQLSYPYDRGYNPTLEFAVSDDGEHLAMMGLNADLLVYDTYSGCGDMATDYNMHENRPINVLCPTANVHSYELIERFAGAFLPRFNSDGDQLGFFISSYSVEPREILMQVAGYNNQRVDYLAMGDSFQGGEGEIDDKFYLDGTNNANEKCHVSSRSYPFIIAKAQGIDLNYTKSVACSSAVMKDIKGGDDIYLGQGKRLSKKVSNFTDSERIAAQFEAIFSFIPGRVIQKKFAERYQPKVITVGIGGNDAEFMLKLRACLGAGTCDYAGSEKSRAQSAEEIKSLFDKFVQTYTEIYKASPGSKIYVIGYPKIIDQNKSCGFAMNRLLDDKEKQFINEGIKYLNEVISAAARAAGVKYIDIFEVYGESVLCGSDSQKSMNGIRLGDDNYVSELVEWYRPIGQESFHPTPLGHINNANAIMSAASNIIDYDYCGNGTNHCPQNNIVAPEPSEYWSPNLLQGITPQRSYDFISNQTSVNEDVKTIELARNILMPKSEVRIEVASTPTNLGTFRTSDDGSFNISVELPQNLEEGFHTLRIYGINSLGNPIELYQIFEYKKTETTDAKVNSEKLNTATVTADKIKIADEASRTIIGKIYIPDVHDKFVLNKNISVNRSVDKIAHKASNNSTIIILVYCLVIVFFIVLVSVVKY